MQSRTKDILFKVGAAIVCILAYAMTSNLENNVARPSYCCGPQDDWHGLAAKTISRSSMWSSDKTEAIQALLSNGPTGYYQSIISIVNSSMWSSDKLSAIKRESAKFADTFTI